MSTTPEPAEPVEPAQQSEEAPPAETGRERLWLFGGIYGTVLASAVLAALHNEGNAFNPDYEAAWIVIAAMSAALAHGYAHHMSEHAPGAYRRRLSQLVLALADEWTLVAASLPTVLLLLLAGVGHWRIKPVTYAGLSLNIVLLFAWGMSTARRAGQRPRSAIATGAADATLGLLIVVANALIK